MAVLNFFRKLVQLDIWFASAFMVYTCWTARPTTVLVIPISSRMENGVLGNALEGVQVEEEEEKADDSMVESADNIDGM